MQEVFGGGNCDRCWDLLMNRTRKREEWLSICEYAFLSEVSICVSPDAGGRVMERKQTDRCAEEPCSFEIVAILPILQWTFDVKISLRIRAASLLWDTVGTHGR